MVESKRTIGATQLRTERLRKQQIATLNVAGTGFDDRMSDTTFMQEDIAYLKEFGLLKTERQPANSTVLYVLNGRNNEHGPRSPEQFLRIDEVTRSYGKRALLIGSAVCMGKKLG